MTDCRNSLGDQSGQPPHNGIMWEETLGLSVQISQQAILFHVNDNGGGEESGSGPLD